MSQIIFVDAALAVTPTGSDAVGHRYYAADPPYRLLLVLPAGLDWAAIQPGAYLQAQLGWDDGAGPYTLPASAGKRPRRITVEALVTEPPPAAQVYALSALVAAAPRSDRPGGRRGEKIGRLPLTPNDPQEAHSVTLPASLWRRIEQLGGGNRSAGVRRLAEGALESSG